MGKIRCRYNKDCKHQSTFDKIYNYISKETDYYKIIDDEGDTSRFYTWRFEEVREAEKVKKIKKVKEKRKSFFSLAKGKCVCNSCVHAKVALVEAPCRECMDNPLRLLLEKEAKNGKES